MATKAQAKANRLNAWHSTGPRTDEGKAASSLNAIKHGLTAKTVLLPGEDQAAYDSLCAAMLESFNPRDAAQAALAQELIDTQWRLLRVSSLEARFLSAEPPDMKSFAALSSHAARLKRQYTASLKELLLLQDRFRKTYEENMEKAALLHHADFIHNRPSSAATFGFDFSYTEIENYIGLREGLKKAHRTLDARNVNWTRN